MAKVIGNRWRIVEALPEGGQAHTYKVVRADNSDPTVRVLKRLKNETRLDRFRDEIAAISSIRHPNVVELIEHDLDCAEPYFVMEYCEGGSLSDEPFHWYRDIPYILEFFAQVCDGAAAAHAAGRVHRDIKPSNVLMRSQGAQPVLADFGLVFIEGGERRTLVDEAVGSRLFMAPEMESGRAELVTAKADVYSLGKLLYWMLNNGKVFAREQHHTPGWDLVDERQMPEFERINILLDNMLKVEPHERKYGTGAEVAPAVRFVANLTRHGYRVVNSRLPVTCLYCGMGEYKRVRAGSPIEIGNFGLSPAGVSAMVILACSFCGNVQLFRPDLADHNPWKLKP